MRMPWQFQKTLGCAMMISLMLTSARAQNVAELQERFDRETSSVNKARLLVKLGDAQFEKARRAGKEGDNNTVGLTMEKYRDNVRAALEALKNQHPDAERHSNGYRQLEMHVEDGIREVQDSILAAPDPYKPPLQIVRTDLIAMDEEMIRLLFPRRPSATKPASPTKEKQP
jgi:hypothetical protein